MRKVLSLFSIPGKSAPNQRRQFQIAPLKYIARLGTVVIAEKWITCHTDADLLTLESLILHEQGIYMDQQKDS